MISRALLTLSLLTIATLYLLAICVYLGHSVWRSWYDRRRATQLQHGRAILRRVVQAGKPDEADLRSFHRLPRRLREELIVEIMRNLAGASRRRARALAAESGLIDRAEEQCTSRFWWRRLEGVRVLTLLEAGEEVVPRLFRDADVEIRTQAAEWAAFHPSEENVHELVSLLADPEPLFRFTVQDSLLRIGLPAAEPLRGYLESHTGTAAASALVVAIGMPGPRFHGPALTLRTDSEPVVRARAACLLGSIGGAGAESALLELLQDDDSWPRAAAAQALGLLGVHRAVPALAELLTDSAWIVRREAALALKALGSPGLLFLRRSLRSPDRFAADIAQHVLETPEGELGRRMSEW